MLTRKQLEKLNKEELVNYALNITDIKEKLDDVERSVTQRFELQEIEFNEKLEKQQQSFNKNIEKLEGELALARKANGTLRADWEKKDDELTGRLTALEREAYRTAEYVNYETVELSKIPLSIPDEEVPAVTLKIVNALNRTDEQYGHEHVHAIHRRQGQFTKEKVLLKFVCRADTFDVLQAKTKLRNMDLKKIDKRLIHPVYINEFISPYYAKLRYACKQLEERKLIAKHWVSGHKVKAVREGETEPRIIGHKDDLFKLVNGKDITEVIANCKL